MSKVIQLNTVKAVDLDSVFRKVRKNRIRRLGIELEGGWNKLPPGVKLQHDGSIHLDDVTGLKCIGELPSPPLAMDAWENWLKLFYPHKVNASCGMHVHFSFNNAFSYQRLMDARYPATVIAYMTQWAKEEKLDKDHPIWPRVKGQCEYCQHVFCADEQVKMTSKDHDRRRAGNRYSVVNFCYGRQGTLECRLLPMMETAEQAVNAIQYLVDTTNAFLVKSAAREQRFKVVAGVDQNIVRESRKIYV